ncbi:MAG: hypothetical protein SNJ63_01955 [Sphingomonadaceae bacterium]
MSDDEEDFDDEWEFDDDIYTWDLVEVMDKSGEKIIELSWDIGTRFHSGFSIIYSYSGFFFHLSEEEGMKGPFATLEQVLEDAHFHTEGIPRPDIRCTLELEESDVLLRAAYDMAGEPGQTVLINDKVHVRLRWGVLARRNDKDGSLTLVYASPHG